MSIRETTVFIYLPNESKAVPAGIFSHDSDLQTGIFSYGHRYLERTNALPVDPVNLPLGIVPIPVTTNGGLYGAFRDATPDYWGRMVIAAQLHVAPETLTEFDFLLEPQATRIGNLDFRISPSDPEPALSPPQFNRLSDILQAADDIDQGRPVEPHLLKLIRQGSSMGGARPKCTVQLDDALWIAKFPSRSDTINIPRVEFATLKLASLCNIRIPEIRILKIDKKDILLVKRFDRDNGAPGWQRKGYLSSLTLMQLDEYDRLQWSYITLASLMRRYCKAEDIHELFRRMIFNILVRNTDDHPRNHGFLSSEAGLMLSPAFDIVPTLAYKGVDTSFDLAMTVGVHGRLASIDNALSVCGQFGLSEESARDSIHGISKIVTDWQHHFTQCEVNQHDLKLLQPSFHLQKIV